MSIVNPTDLEIADSPEIILGLVAAVGAPVGHVQTLLTNELESRDYAVQGIRMSSLIGAVEGEDEEESVVPDGTAEYQRIKGLMMRGTALRSRTKGGDVLALLAAAEISGKRDVTQDLPILEGQCFVLRQLKHPDEVRALRLIYGDAFHLIGVYSPEDARLQNLEVNLGMSAAEAQDLILTDQGEDQELGQQLRDTFHLADVFIPLSDPGEAESAEAELHRYFSLIFADHRESIPTPTPDEFGMFLAWCSSLRSSDLSRQVGATILSEGCEVVSVGCNEVPSAGGGQYWCGDVPDGRDVVKGEDSNTVKKQQVLAEVLEVVDDEFAELGDDERKERLKALTERLGPTRVMNLTEFGRAVHAEMEALLAAARVGVSVRRAHLYTTTFPCHNCAKHIVDAGVSRVVYVEPYPKSLAMELHDDSIRLEDEEHHQPQDERVRLENFVGVAPRRYASLFAMRSPEGIKFPRKDKEGKRIEHVAGLRTRATALNYMQREAVAAAALKEFIASEQQGELDLG